MDDALPKLMLVTDRRRVRAGDLVHAVREAVRGGVGLVQVREKDLDDEALVELVARIRDALPGGVRLTVNSSAGVARALACGLHLPAGAPLPERADFPLVGRSVHDDDEAARAAAEGVDYVVLGPVFPTPSKPGHPGCGTGRLREIVERVAPMPVLAIGGIHVSRVPDVVHAGAWGVAVCGALLDARDPRRVAEALSLALGVAAAPGPAGPDKPAGSR